MGLDNLVSARTQTAGRTLTCRQIAALDLVR